MATKIPKTPKIGTTYSFTRRNGEAVRGKLTAVEDAANGTWCVMAVKGLPKPVNVRPSELGR